MRKDKPNNQLPPYLLGYWIKNHIKDGVVIKKKNTHNVKINIYEQNKPDDKKDDDDDDIMRIILKLYSYIQYTIYHFFYI